AGAGHDERRLRRGSGNRVRECIERWLGRCGQRRGHVGAGYRVLLTHQEVPLAEQRAIALVEGVEPLEREGGGTSQLDAAEGGARPALRLEVELDLRESVAPGDRRTERGVDDLPPGRGHDTGGECRDTGQVAVSAVRTIAEHGRVPRPQSVSMLPSPGHDRRRSRAYRPDMTDAASHAHRLDMTDPASHAVAAPRPA